MLNQLKSDNSSNTKAIEYWKRALDNVRKHDKNVFLDKSVEVLGFPGLGNLVDEIKLPTIKDQDGQINHNPVREERKMQLQPLY